MPGILEIDCAAGKRDALAMYLRVFLDKGETCRDCRRTPPTIAVRNLVGTDICVARAQEDLLAAAGISCDDESYVVTLDAEPLMTPYGRLIASSNRRALDSLASELEYSGVLDVGGVTSYGLVSTSLDFGREPVEMWDTLRTRDAVIHDPLLMTSADRDLDALVKCMQPLVDYLASHGITFPLSYTEPKSGEPLFSGPDVHSVVELVQTKVRSFDEVHLAAFSTGNRAFGSPMMGLLLADAAITGHEAAVMYATSEAWRPTQRDAERVLLKDAAEGAEVVLRFVTLFSASESELVKLVRCGESATVEFKSTLRKNLHTGKSDPRIQHEVLKTVSAFLNTDGGTLLVGIADDGEVVGLEPDGFASEDKVLRHFHDLVCGRIGRQHASLVHASIQPFEGKAVLRVDCGKSSKPVYVMTDGREEFFIRTGPATVALEGSAFLAYCTTHFQQAT